MKFKAAILAIGIIGALGGVFYAISSSRPDSTQNLPVTLNAEKLLVSPQEAQTSVTIDSVTLAQSGFVILRSSDGKRLSQVIEMSQYLEPGEYKNITIELGDFYEYKPEDQLIAMIYHDEGDKTFNELDQPAVNSPAVFIKTGRPVPPSIFNEQVIAGGGTGMATVRYTDSGFQPAKISVSAGTMVEFINQSNNVMWVASNVHPEHEILPTFDQFKTVGKGESYMYVFDKKGSWEYHDHISPAFEGVINVE